MKEITILLGFVLWLFVITSVPETMPVQVLHIGQAKQLFIDEFIIETQNGLTKVMHQPERYRDNPIIVGDKPWERWQIEANGHPALYDEESKEFKLYYGCNLAISNHWM